MFQAETNLTFLRQHCVKLAVGHQKGFLLPHIDRRKNRAGWCGDKGANREGNLTDWLTFKSYGYDR